MGSLENRKFACLVGQAARACRMTVCPCRLNNIQGVRYIVKSSLFFGIGSIDDPANALPISEAQTTLHYFSGPCYINNA